MSRMLTLSSRNAKEIFRDASTYIFGIALPVALLVIMGLIGKNTGVPNFQVGSFAPGMAVFSMSFITLFSGILIARDRGTSFLARLLASPMTASDFILGYAFPLLPAAVVQTAVCLATAFALGLPAGSGALLCVVALLPSALLFVGLGLLFGCLFSEKQVAPLSSVLVNVVSLLGGVWFDVSLLGGALKTFCEVLPFTHCVYAARYGLSGDMGAALPHMLIVLAYAAAVFFAAVLVFRRRIRSGNP